MPQRDNVTTISLTHELKDKLMDVLIDSPLNNQFNSWDDFWEWVINRIEEYNEKVYK